MLTLYRQLYSASGLNDFVIFQHEGLCKLKFRVKQATLLGVFGPEERHITLLRDVGKYVMVYTA